MLEGYMTANEAAKKWEISVRAVQLMCTNNKIKGTVKFGRAWAIPVNAEKTADNRVTTGRYRDCRKSE